MSQINFTSRRNAVDVTGNKTLAATDCGIVQNVTATATISLPAVAAGLEFVVRVGADSITVNITPNGTDQLAGNGFTAANSKGAVSTNGRIGDEITVGAGTATWYATQIQGVWTRQP